MCQRQVDGQQPHAEQEKLVVVPEVNTHMSEESEENIHAFDIYRGTKKLFCG